MVNLVRSRWAAVGAAVAVTLGGGGLIGVSASSSSSTLVPIAPVRVLDTRASDMVGDITDGASITVQITGSIATASEGTKTVVPSGASAITGNMTMVSTTSNDFGGYATIYPCGSRPDASNINFTSGQTVANSVAVPLSASGTVCIYVYGTAHVLLDVSGYYTKSEIADLAERVAEVEGEIVDLSETAVVYDSDGVPYALHVLTPSGFMPGRWESFANTDTKRYLFTDGEYWGVYKEGVMANTVLLAYFTSSDCSGTQYAHKKGEWAEDDDRLEFDSQTWTEETISVPLLTQRTLNDNNFEVGKIFKVRPDLSNEVEPSEINSWYYMNRCQENESLYSPNYATFVAVVNEGELDLGINFPLTTTKPD